MTFKAYSTKDKHVPPYETVSYALAQSFADEQNGWVENADGRIVYGRKPTGTIDFTPTWRAIVPIIIAALTDGTDEAKNAAKAELYNMAKAADAYNASVKD